MSESTENNETPANEAADAEPATAETAEPTEAQPVAADKTRLRDRVFGIRGLAAVALASLILGGAGGAAIGAASAGDDRDHDRGHPGMNNGQFPGGGQFGGRGQSDDRQFLPPGSSQVPPTTEPEGDES